MAQKQAVLVIDDEEAVREALSDILGMEDLAVLTAPNGETGVLIYSQKQADIALVILDMSMPGLGGKETLRGLKQINPDVRVLLSSGFTQGEVIESVADLSVTGFLQKPYNVVQLIEVVKEHLAEPGSSE